MHVLLMKNIKRISKPTKSKEKIIPDFSLEMKALQKGIRYIAGVDEAGRGPLAGPVVAAAVILDPNDIPEGLNDSKALSHKKRLILYDSIIEKAHVSIASASPKRIDVMNIRQASLWAMRKAILSLCPEADFALIDGRDAISNLPIPCKAVIKGDARSLSIAAASIIAKVSRDKIMTSLARHYPEYGIEKHMGYPTAMHREALDRLGPTVQHRTSFSPVRSYIIKKNATDSLP
jgi:ribonuclease HII